MLSPSRHSGGHLGDEIKFGHIKSCVGVHPVQLTDWRKKYELVSLMLLLTPGNEANKTTIALARNSLDKAICLGPKN